MHLPHFELEKEPFSISPDPQFLWLGDKHHKAFEVLKEGILEREGCVLLAGDVGTGKTTLIKRLVKLEDVAAIFVTINDPDLGPLDFFNILASEFQIGRQFKSKGEFIAGFKHFLLNAFSAFKKVLLIIDEAQRLNPEILRELVELSNLKLAGRKLLKVFFVGQLEFNAMLMREENQEVLQNITAHFYLEPLSEPETSGYVLHRLKVAGARREIFTPEAMAEIFKASRGYPRAINVICDNALRSALKSGRKRVDARMIGQGRVDFPTEAPPVDLPGKDQLVAGVEEILAARRNPAPADAPQSDRDLLLLGAAIVIVGSVLIFLLL